MIYRIYPDTRVGDVVQVELNDTIHQCLIVARVGTQYRALFPNGAALLVRPYDILTNLTQGAA